MTTANSNRNIIAIVAGLLLAGAIGFALARWTGNAASIAAPEAAPKVAGEQSLEVDAAALATMGIVVGTASSGDLGAEIQAPGLVRGAANSQASVTTHVAGTLTRIEKRLGDSVQAGTVLARLQSSDAARIAAEQSASEAKASAAASALKREQSLFEQKVTPRQDLEMAQAASTAAEADAARARAVAAAAHVTTDGLSMAVVSPITGRITAAPARLGAFVAPETELFQVADPRYVVIEASVSAQDAGQIRSGDAARVTTSQGAALTASVESVTPNVDEHTRSATVVLSLAPKQRALLPGEVATVRIMTKRGESKGIVLDEEAVQMMEGRAVVFVRTEKGFRLQPVTVGSRAGGEVLIASGIEAGAQVATRNAFLLKAEFNKNAGEDEE
ncbi:MAG: efflux RND transporter periplasmic adaptor subunit [Steroidobacteraceae bacterium]